MTSIFEKGCSGRYAQVQAPKVKLVPEMDPSLLREESPLLPQVSELEAIRHFTQLSQLNYCIDTQFYPLGSCTMKYNPRVAQQLAGLPAFLNLHPFTPESDCQGLLACLFELQEYLKILTGMSEVCLSPLAGAQGELTGILMIQAFHQAQQDHQRDEMLVSDAAHGTNPASAAMAGLKVKVVPTNAQGEMDLTALQQLVGPRTAGLMLTNPSTLGIFERHILRIADIVHQAGGLLYYDGANFNALLGKVLPAQMGFDVMHLNTHKTFATPHGGGGPGSGPVCANEKLSPFLPIPRVQARAQNDETFYYWLDETQCPATIGRLSTFMGNIGVLLQAYVYLRLLGAQGLPRVADFACLNANYLMKSLQKLGYQLPFPERQAAHEFIITLAKEFQTHGINALDVAKRLLDENFYAPTVYFPLLIKECLLIEPTETESKQTLDQWIDAMQKIKDEIRMAPENIKNAPSRLTCKRLDETRAARELDLVWKKETSSE